MILPGCWTDHLFKSASLRTWIRSITSPGNFSAAVRNSPPRRASAVTARIPNEPAYFARIRAIRWLVAMFPRRFKRGDLQLA